jgi:hypothetical protein
VCRVRERTSLLALISHTRTGTLTSLLAEESIARHCPSVCRLPPAVIAKHTAAVAANASLPSKFIYIYIYIILWHHSNILLLCRDWYIVACPCAADPFADDDGDGAASAEAGGGDGGGYGAGHGCGHAGQMARLGHALQAAARGFRTARGTGMGLDVGLHCGPAAGAVIGAHRAFYCLYGDTVNERELVPFGVVLRDVTP